MRPCHGEHCYLILASAYCTQCAVCIASSTLCAIIVLYKCHRNRDHGRLKNKPCIYPAALTLCLFRGAL